MAMRQTGRRLIAEEIQKTIDRLYKRISDRFPQSGLAGVCQELLEISRESDQVIEWICRPSYWMRIGVGSVLALLAVAAVYSMVGLDLRTGGLSVSDFFQMTEAALNEVVLLAAGVTFLVTFEARRKRRRVIQAVHRLRYIAHLTDAHQLMKDPDTVPRVSTPMASSPSREITPFELGRYLDYCSEMLSLTGKLGFLYVQDFDDPVANDAVNDLEGLTTGLSQKIWQKIMILRGGRGL